MICFANKQADDDFLLKTKLDILPTTKFILKFSNVGLFVLK